MHEKSTAPCCWANGTRVTHTHPKVSREDVVGGDHHILRGQKRLAPVAIGAVVQIHVDLDVSTHVLFKLVLEVQTDTHAKQKGE